MITASCTQYTISNTVFWEGVGMHSGKYSKVWLHPSNNGLYFRVGDIQFLARWNYVVDTTRCTVVGAEGRKVSTVEHLLSALAGSGITDAVIEVEGEEIPILDGSALPFYEAVEHIGLSKIADFEPVKLKRTAVNAINKRAIACPGELSVSGMIAFKDSFIGIQRDCIELNSESYKNEIAPARTFGFMHEISALRANGLALGGSLENALIIDEHGYSSELRIPNEPLRHKFLDLLGDLALIGRPIGPMALCMMKSSHQLNVELARKIAEEID